MGQNLDSGKFDPTKFDPITVSRNFKVCSLDEINEYSVKLGWDVVYSQLGAGSYDGQYREGVSESLIVSREILPVPLSMKTAGFPGYIALANYSSSAPAKMNGAEIQSDSFMLALPGADVDINTQGPGEFTIALVPESEVENKLGDSYSAIRKGFGNQGVISGQANTEVRLFFHWFQEWASDPFGEAGGDPSVTTRRLHSIVCNSLQNLAQELDRPAGKTGTKFDLSKKQLARLIDFFHHHPTEALSVEDMCQISGMGHRNLYYSFKKYTGYTPQHFFRDIRLGYLHRELVADAGDVTTLALKYNFDHLGECSAYYKATYGELPSETLKKTRIGASGRI